MQGILGLLFLIVSLTDPISNMNQQELISFMEAIKEQENAGGNYLLEHKPTKMKGYNGEIIDVQALGAYGILDVNWNKWSKQAGYEGADWRTPEMQDIVAAYKFSEYYNKYGSWDLVAVAWYGGPGKANTAMNAGIDAIGDTGNIEGFGPNIQEYVSSVMDKYSGYLEKQPVNVDVESYIQQNKQEIQGPPKLNTQDDGMVPGIDPMQKYAADMLSALVPNRTQPVSDVQFESQVPQQAGSFEGAKIKTEIVRDNEDKFTIDDILSTMEPE